MRKVFVSLIILLIALSLLTIGLVENQFALISTFYTQMNAPPVPPAP